MVAATGLSTVEVLVADSTTPRVRRAIESGMSVTDAFREFGVL